MTSTAFNNVIPKSLDFFSQVEKLAGVQKRTESYIYPETGNNNYGPNQIIRFRFNAGMLDFRDSMWEFTATCSQTGGTYCRFSQGIACIVNRLVVKVGSNTIIDTIYFNQLYQLFLLSQDPTFLTTSAAVLQGYTSASQRSTDGSNSNRYYNLNLGYICELLAIVWPADFISDQVTVEIYLEDPNRCLESDGTGGITYVVNTNQYHYGVFECTEEYLGMVRDKIATDGIMIPYKAYENYVGNIVANATNIQTVLPFKKQCLLGISYCCRNNANIILPATNDKFQTFLNYSVYNSSRIKINDNYFPTDKVLNTYEAYIQNLEFWDVDHLEPVQFGNNWSQYFTLSQSITQDPRHLEQNDIISGIDTSQATSTITAELILNTGGAPALEEVQYFGQFYGMMYIRPNRTITFQQ